MNLGDFRKLTENLPDSTVIGYPVMDKGYSIVSFADCWLNISCKGDEVSVVLCPGKDLDDLWKNDLSNELKSALTEMLADAETLNEPWRNEAICEKARAVLAKAGSGQQKYDAKQIARELIATARREAYHGNALYAVKDMPGLTDEERWVILRWLDGFQCSTDTDRLEDIAHKIAADAV